MSIPALDSPDWQSVNAALSPILAEGSISLAGGPVTRVVGPATPWASTFAILQASNGDAFVEFYYSTPGDASSMAAGFALFLSSKVSNPVQLIVPTMGDVLSLVTSPLPGATGKLDYNIRGMSTLSPPRIIPFNSILIDIENQPAAANSSTVFYPANLGSGFIQVRSYAAASGLSLFVQNPRGSTGTPTPIYYPMPAGNASASFYLSPENYIYTVQNTAAAAIDFFLTVSVML